MELSLRTAMARCNGDTGGLLVRLNNRYRGLYLFLSAISRICLVLHNLTS